MVLLGFAALVLIYGVALSRKEERFSFQDDERNNESIFSDYFNEFVQWLGYEPVCTNINKFIS